MKNKEFHQTKKPQSEESEFTSEFMSENNHSDFVPARDTNLPYRQEGTSIDKAQLGSIKPEINDEPAPGNGASDLAKKEDL
jgi:hypothetical protein